MIRTTTYFVRFYKAGGLIADEWDVATSDPDPYAVVWPDGAYAFKLFKQGKVMVGEESFTGKTEQIGPVYYHPDSKVETLEQVKLNPKATSILIENMECNGWDRVIWTRWGTWPQPFNPEKARVLENL